MNLFKSFSVAGRNHCRQETNTGASETVSSQSMQSRAAAFGLLALLLLAASAQAQTYTVLTNFSGTNGAQPLGGMAISGGTLFGTTYSGGASNRGIVFKLLTDGSGLATLKDFTGDEGANPLGTLTLADGTLYGTTYNGGHTNSYYHSPAGTVFKLSTDGSGFKVLKTFNHLFKGANPRGGLLVTNRFVY